MCSHANLNIVYCTALTRPRLKSALLTAKASNGQDPMLNLKHNKTISMVLGRPECTAARKKWRDTADIGIVNTLDNHAHRLLLPCIHNRLLSTHARMQTQSCAATKQLVFGSPNHFHQACNSVKDIKPKLHVTIALHQAGTRSMQCEGSGLSQEVMRKTVSSS